MLMSKLPSALALALLAGSLAACHLSPPTSDPIPKTPVQASLRLLPASLDISQANNRQESDPLNLTEDQRRQFAAISQEAMKNDRSAELQRILVAPQLDPTAVRNALTQSDSDITQSVTLQVKLRNLLTPQQRQTLIDNYRQSAQSSEGTMSESQIQDLQKQLNLTAEQLHLLTAMNDALKRHTEANRARLRDAQITLVNTGDGEEFRQALLAANRTMPLDAMIAYFTSLSQAQRQKLFTSSSGSTSGS